jgi:hypothetical protein
VQEICFPPVLQYQQALASSFLRPYHSYFILHKFHLIPFCCAGILSSADQGSSCSTRRMKVCCSSSSSSARPNFVLLSFQK